MVSGRFAYAMASSIVRAPPCAKSSSSFSASIRTNGSLRPRLVMPAPRGSIEPSPDQIAQIIGQLDAADAALALFPLTARARRPSIAVSCVPRMMPSLSSLLQALDIRGHFRDQPQPVGIGAEVLHDNRRGFSRRIAPIASTDSRPATIASRTAVTPVTLRFRPGPRLSEVRNRSGAP